MDDDPKVKAESDEDPCAGLKADELSAHASAFLVRGRHDTAQAFTDEALAREPASVRALVCKALALMQKGDYAEAIEFAERALAVSPTCGTAFVARGCARGKMGDLHGAGADFEEGEALYPDDYRVPYNIACFWAEGGDEDRCREHLARARRLAPANFEETVARDLCFDPFRGRPWFAALFAAGGEQGSGGGA